MAHRTPSLDEMPGICVVRGRRRRPARRRNAPQLRRHRRALPLTDITLAQADALQRRLAAGASRGRHAQEPFIRDTRGARERGIERVVGVPMAPQFSTLACEIRGRRDRGAAGQPAFQKQSSYHSHPLLLQAFASKCASGRRRGLVVFTAHSLPKRVIDAGDVYADEVPPPRGVAALAGITDSIACKARAGRPGHGSAPTERADHARVAASTRSFLVVPVGLSATTPKFIRHRRRAARTAAGAGENPPHRSLNTSPTFVSARET